VWRPDARSAQIGSPDGIVHCFQVNAYSSEPSTSSEARNLLSKDDWRLADRNETLELRPKVAGVVGASMFASSAEWLAGARSSPNRGICRPPCKLKGARPSSDACEEVALGIALKV
jgi:hypothetical protein